MTDSQTPMTDALLALDTLGPRRAVNVADDLEYLARRLERGRAELIAALAVITDHACETYPHFEDARGQRDIAQARAVLAKVGT